NFCFKPSCSRHDFVELQTKYRSLGHRDKHLVAFPAFHRFEKRSSACISHSRPSCQAIQHFTAADGNDRRKLPYDEPVARLQQNFFLRPQMAKCILARRKDAFAIEKNLSDCLRRPSMKMHARTMLQLARGRKQCEPHIYSASTSKTPRRRQRHPALHVAVIDPSEIYCRPLPRDGAFDGFPAGVYAANAKPFA